jgi:hypothetical protein
MDVGVQIEAVQVRLARAAGADVGGVRIVPYGSHPGAGARAQGDAALDRSAGEAGQQRRGLGEGVRRLRVRGPGVEIAPNQQALHAPADGGKHLGQVIRFAGGGVM